MQMLQEIATFVGADAKEGTSVLQQLQLMDSADAANLLQS